MNLILTKRNSHKNPLGALELAIGQGGNEIGGIVNSCLKGQKRMENLKFYQNTKDLPVQCSVCLRLLVSSAHNLVAQLYHKESF